MLTASPANADPRQPTPVVGCCGFGSRSERELEVVAADLVGGDYLELCLLYTSDAADE